MKNFLFALVIMVTLAPAAFAQNGERRTFSGVTLTAQSELVPSVSVEVETGNGKLTATTDGQGEFRLDVPRNDVISVTFSGKNIVSSTRIFQPGDKLENLQIRIAYRVAPVHESVVIEDDTLSPGAETRRDTIYNNTLFGRDDQLIQTLNAGINAGQHEGGGKSLEIRRFGFNLDHGGVNGGLKILVDNFQQNQGTQGHGQGYLGSLKSFSPELVQDVSIINGPFSAQYGDFSGLGVVHIRQKESLPQQLTLRVQGGSFGTRRAFLAYSPEFKRADAFIAYEGSSTDGPFESPLRYRRHNFTGNYTYKFSERQALGFKLNGGINDFFSSGQIPLDLVATGDLDRFGFIDPDNGGAVQSGFGGVYYRREWESGRTFKADAFVSRSLFDLWSNFTFFQTDTLYSDEIQQHDSRLQAGANAQFLQPYKFFGNQSLLTVGGNFHANQIKVALYPSVGRDPIRKFLPENINNPDVLLTSARANVNNYAVYVQNSAGFFDDHLRIEAGLRLDVFTFGVNGFELRDGRFSLDGKETAAAWQPKLGVAWTPSHSLPATLYLNYGRGISSQDARGVIRNPDSPKISTTDFYQTGAAYNSRRISLSSNFFFIDRSNEQVYIPDDGSIEFAGRSRSYGVEARTSVKINRFLSFNGGLTQVLRAFYPGEFIDGGNNSRQRVIIDSAPHTVANASLIFSELRGFNFSVNYRHISSYRLDAENPSIRASGHDVVDFALSKRLRRWVDFNISIDNLLNKRYYETQNFFESRACPTCTTASRIHATPGYPFTVSVGFTFRLFAKN